MTGELLFRSEDHSYWVDGKRLPSVTTIIKPLDSFEDIPPSVLERKRLIGQDVHFACELLDLCELDIEITDTEVMGYVNAWRRFLRETGAQVLMSEQRLYHPVLRVAGTLDRVIQLPDVKRLLIDIKTSADPLPSYGVQLSGYQILLEANGDKVNGRATVHLRTDGTYLLHPFKDPNDRTCFMALLTLFHWKAAHP